MFLCYELYSYFFISEEMHRLPPFETFSTWVSLELVSNAIAMHPRPNNTNCSKIETKNKQTDS